MAVHDCTYVNSASTSVNLNGTDYRLVNPGPQGIYHPMRRPSILASPRQRPAGIYLEHLEDQREIILPLRVSGTSQSDFIGNLGTLWTALSVDHRDKKLGTLTYTAPNGAVRSIKCTTRGVDASQWYMAGLTDATDVRLDLPLICPDPTFYNPTPVTPSGAFSGTSNVTISCANAGDEDAFLTITITTDGAQNLINPRITDAYGRFLLFTATMAVSKTLVLTLDPQNLSMLYDGTTDWFLERSTGSRLIVAKYGTNNLIFSNTNASANATIAISFCSTYSRHG